MQVSRRHRFDPWVRKIPGKRKWQPPPVFLPGKSHGQRSLVGYSSWGCEELDMSECTYTHTHTLEMKKHQQTGVRGRWLSSESLKMWNFAFNPGHPWWWEAKNLYFLLAEWSVIIWRRKGIHNRLPFLVGSYWAQPTASFSIWAQHRHLPSNQKLGWYLGTKLLLFLVSERSWHQQKSYFQVSHSRATNFTIPWDWTLLCELAWVLPRVARKKWPFFLGT